MSKGVKNLDKRIDLGDGLTLEYQKPETFSHYLSVYHGQLYASHYFRMAPSLTIDKAKYLDAGYFIKKENRIIGGVFLKPNFMTDLFVVPPFKDYAFLAKKLLDFLKGLVEGNDKISIQQIPEELTSVYTSLGCKVGAQEYFMIRPTEEMDAKVPLGYESRAIVDEDVEDVVDLIIKAYEHNPCMTELGSREFYVTHVKEFLKRKDDEVIYNSSKVVVHKESGDIVGTCLHTEFEEIPLIMSFVVDPDHQKQGIGSYLLKHSISYSHKKYNATRLAVDYNNEAIHVYEHLGFVKYKKLDDLSL